MWITMVKAQVDMNFTVICERIMELQPSKKKKKKMMMMMMMNDHRFRRRLVPIVDASLSGHIIVFCIVFQFS